jgi:cation transport ATPase
MLWEPARRKQVWRAAVALLALGLTIEVGRTIVVERSLDVDTIALVAMVGALALNQELAGAVIGLMFSGGAALEAVASRARGRPARQQSGGRRKSSRCDARLGVDRVYAEMSPEDKFDVVRRVRAERELRPVIMVGDGINDAPALALADLGIAMGAAGATVSSETADAVIMVDRVDRVADALHIGRRALFIARQSVLAGRGLSLAAMGVAAVGYLPPH